MNDMGDPGLRAYYRSGESWAEDRARKDRNSFRLVCIGAGAMTLVAVLEALALVLLVPLKTVEPYTVLVDRHTGYVEKLDPLDHQTITPDAALTRSFLVQYVIAREGFNIAALRHDYRKVALWSAGDARKAYIDAMKASSADSPLVRLPRQAVVSVDMRSVSPLGKDTALVRFSTTRTDPGGRSHPPETWAAVIVYRFTAAAMATADRFVNPLGFQVVRYTRTPEVLPPAPAAQDTRRAIDPASSAGAGL